MKKLTAIIALAFGLCLTANADVWKWVDEYGKVHYSDKPEHESAVSVKLDLHSTGYLSDSSSTNSQTDTSRDKEIDPNETVDERQEREMAEAYYCKQAKEIYDLLANAPRLYRTNADGQREFLSDEAAAATLAESETRVSELCN